MYIANKNGSERNGYIKRNLLQIFFFGLPLVCLVNFLLYLTHSNMQDAKVFFFVAVLPCSLTYVLFFLFATLRMMKRWNKTINEIDFKTSEVQIKTFSALWLKSKEYSLLPFEYKIKSSIFTWYGKDEKEGKIIINYRSKFYLVKDYFDYYNEIIKRLST